MSELAFVHCCQYNFYMEKSCEITPDSNIFVSIRVLCFVMTAVQLWLLCLAK